MALDPQIQLLVDNIPGGIALPAGVPVEEARTRFRAITTAMRDNQPPADLAATEDTTVPGAEADFPARIYRPHAAGATPTFLFIHGGGFIIGDVEAYDFQARTLAERTGFTVISVEYRLAPEHPWPAAADDAEAIARWVVANVGSLGGDPSRVLVGGDSAGGNLSAVVSQNVEGFTGVVLLYPTVDFTSEKPAHIEHAGGPLLTGAAGQEFRAAYVGDSDPHDPRLSPLQGDLAKSPPAVVATAEYDILRDDGLHYVERLEAAGVPVKHFHYPTLMHGFFGFGPLSEAANSAIDEICAAAVELAGAPATV